MPTEVSLQRNDHGYIQSLDRGLHLLEMLSLADEPQGLPELANALTVDRATAHRLLRTLVRRGFVNQDSDTKRYRLGMKVIELTRRVVDNSELRIIAQPYLERLVRLTGESANLALLVKNQVVCVHRVPSPLVLAVTNEVGDVFALHATACGKILLANLPEEHQQQLLTAGPLPGYTPRTITDLSSLKSHLDRIQKQGFATDDEERFAGVRCIATPLRDHKGNVIGAISISAPTSRMTLDRFPDMIKIVQETAKDISHDLGYPTDNGVQVEDHSAPS